MKSSKPSLFLRPPLDLKDSAVLMLQPIIVLLLPVALVPRRSWYYVGAEIISISSSSMTVRASIGSDAGALAEVDEPPRATQGLFAIAFYFGKTFMSTKGRREELVKIKSRQRKWISFKKLT